LRKLFKNTKPVNRQYLQPVIYSLLLTAGIITGFFISPPEKSRFYQILDIIKTDYVEQPNPRELEEDAITGMLTMLDPHSSFIPAEMVTYSQRQIRGNYQGIGVDFVLYKDTPVLVLVNQKGPAFVGGLTEGDRIIAANDVKMYGKEINRNKLIAALSGLPGTTLNLRIYRPRNNRIIEVTIRRGQVPIKSVETFYKIDRFTGLIQISSFSSTTHKEFRNALELLLKEGVKNIVIDIRNNGGGLLREAIKVSNEFLEKGDIITYTKGRKRKTEQYKADGKGLFKEGRVILITNRYTASASEILAGALQDNDRALIIGTRTFGKGLVQEPYQLPDGSSLKLTVARYFTPSGRSIQKPYTRDVAAYRQEIFRRNEPQKSISQDLDSFFTKKGRQVYAGGGIHPDFLLSDTLNEVERFEKQLPGLFHSGMLQVFIFDKLRNELKKVNKEYTTAFSFSINYTPSPAVMKACMKFINSHEKYKNLKINPISENLLRKYLKAAIGKQSFGEVGYHQIINREEGLFSRIQLALLVYDKELKTQNKISP
jgi:carboxyl-terminal processing protease